MYMNLLIIAIIFCFAFLNAQGQNFEVGQGYFSDTQSFSPAKCFESLEVIKSHQSATFSTDSWQSSKEIAQSIPGYNSRGRFSKDPLHSFLKSIEDDDFSVSLNYLYKVSQWNHISYSYNQKELLNSFGLEMFKNCLKQNCTSICGDTLVTDYEEGAMVIISIKITFKNLPDKMSFQQKMGLKPSGIIDASQTLQDELKGNYKGGEVTVSAFQLGGDPIQLSSVFSMSLVKCELSKTDQCQESLQTLFNYVKESFPKQLTSSTEPWKNPFVPLGGFIKGPLVSDLGLCSLPRTVTTDTLQARKSLFASFEHNRNQKVYFKTLVNLGLGGEVAKKNLEKIEANLDLLENGLLSGSAIDCWKRPSSCVNISSEILGALETLDYNPKNTKLCGKPEESGITLAAACANLKGEYVGTYWDEGNFLGSSLPNDDGMCYAKAMGIKMTLDGVLRIPCQLQAYLPFSPFE